MEFLQKWFTGYRFWLTLAMLNLLILLIGVIAGSPEAYTAVVMWIAFATAEILKAIENKQQ